MLKCRVSWKYMDCLLWVVARCEEIMCHGHKMLENKSQKFQACTHFLRSIRHFRGQRIFRIFKQTLTAGNSDFFLVPFINTLNNRHLLISSLLHEPVLTRHFFLLLLWSVFFLSYSANHSFSHRRIRSTCSRLGLHYLMLQQ